MPSELSPARDAAAFEDEVAPHLPWLLRMALRLTRHEQAAEDLLQGVLERGFVHFGRYLPATNVRAWLFQIMPRWSPSPWNWARLSANSSAARRRSPWFSVTYPRLWSELAVPNFTSDSRSSERDSPYSTPARP